MSISCTDEGTKPTLSDALTYMNLLNLRFGNI